MIPTVKTQLLSKRDFLKLSGMAGIGALTLGTTACPGDKKKINFYAATASATMAELKLLLPNQADEIGRGIDLIKSFNDAYQGGQFDSALTFFEGFASIVSSVIAAAGVDLGDNVKLALAAVNIAVRGIAVLMKDAASSPAVAAVVKEKAQASDANARRVTLIESLASPKAINAVFEASRP